MLTRGKFDTPKKATIISKVCIKKGEGLSLRLLFKAKQRSREVENGD